MANDIKPLSDATLIRPEKNTDAKSTVTNQITPSTQNQLKPGQDEVKMSNEVLQLQRLQNLIKDLPDVDLDKVAALKQAIASGSYEIDSKTIADKLIDLEFTNKE